MGSKLLIRSYNVGCGDCTYIRIPNNKDGFHILIDCGSKEKASTGLFARVIKHLETDLPDTDEDGKKRLDLVVVTHRHEDHIKGFDPEYFENIAIQNIWITAAMNESHIQAKKSRALHEYVASSIKELSGQGSYFSHELRELVELYGIRNSGATEALTKIFPQANGIKPKYVHAGQTSDDLDVAIDDTKILVLAPEQDIDHFYLGKELDDRLLSLHSSSAEFRSKSFAITSEKPTNINSIDFSNLQSRILSSALAFALNDTKIQNNVSTVLLIEWKGKRLLFVGDAEWEENYREGRKNGSWNVMWNNRKEHLSKPVDFLKVGHHGSFNATPWIADEGPDHEVNQILNSILPLPKDGKKPIAQCVVSTKRTPYETIPDAELLVELGKRVKNTKKYLSVFEDQKENFDPEMEIYNYSFLKEYTDPPSPREVGDKGWLDKSQPLRTDMESEGKGLSNLPDVVEFIDIEIEA